MRRLLGGFGLAAACAAAPAAEAQQIAEPAGPVLGPVVPPGQSDMPRQSIGISSRVDVDAAGRVATRRGLVGTLPLSRNVEAVVGLFSVIGNGPRRPAESRRNWSVRDMTERDQRIAAVGVKLRF